MSITALHYYGLFVETCENFGLDHKYVLFSVVASLLAGVSGLLFKGVGKTAWLTAKGGFYVARGTVRYFRPKPSELGQLVLDAFSTAVYVHDAKAPMLHGRGCCATLQGPGNVTVAVDGRFITEMLDAATEAKLIVLFKKEQAAFEAKLKEEAKKFAADREKQTKLALLRAKAIDSMRA